MLLKNSSLPTGSLRKSKIFIACSLCLSLTTLSYTPEALAQKVSGKIIDHQGKAIAFATVKINGGDQKVLTDKQGFFSFEKLSAGNIELHASAKKYAHSNQHIMIKQNDISDLLIELSPSVMEVIDVYATPLHSSTIESALPVNVISGDELKLKQAATLGETLKNEVGVHSSFYGSVASSPIIRGLDGPRVLITQNGLDAGDASRVGADHVVATETSTATQIEVLRGPATLFYGSGAIGGVVNVVDNRVPTSTDTIADWLLQYNDVANEKLGSFSLQDGMKIAGEDFAIHLDGFWRDAGDYQLPDGFKPKEHEEHEEHEEEANTDTLANSSSKSSGFTLGSSYLFDQGFIGFSYGTMDRDYGIPGHMHHEEDEGHEEHEGHEEGTKAKMKQDRFQVLSEVNFEQGLVKQLATQFAYTDYQHQEIEDGAVGTTFTNKSFEMKADIYHQDYMGWQGAWTLHFKQSDFKAVGEEAFSPPSNTDTWAVAWLEEKHFDDVLLQFGARVERVTIDVEDSIAGFEDHDEHAGEHDDEHDDEHEIASFAEQKFTPISVSLGAVWDYQQGYNLGASFALSQRAPSSAELFSFGPHIGTHSYEVGAMFDLEEEDDEIHVEPSSKTPELETSYSADLTWRKFEGDFGFVVSAFYNHVEDYYYQQDTGHTFEHEHDDHEDINSVPELSEEAHEDHEDGLPILVYQQSDIDMYGIEAEFVYQIFDPLKVTLFGDYIHAKLSDGGYLPRIPPMRIGTSLNYQGERFGGEFSVNHYFEQNDTAPLETSTKGYTMLDMNVNYYFDDVGINGSDMVLYIKGQNLTDEVALVHTSFLKDIAPLPGRGFSIGLRGSF